MGRDEVAELEMELDHYQMKVEEARAFKRRVLTDIGNYQSDIAVLRKVLTAVVARLEEHGNWDDGCFYYAGRAAPELQDPLMNAKKALK